MKKRVREGLVSVVVCVAFVWASVLSGCTHTVRFTTKPDGASVKIDGLDVGTTDLQFNGVQIGPSHAASSILGSGAGVEDCRRTRAPVAMAC